MMSIDFRLYSPVWSRSDHVLTPIDSLFDHSFFLFVLLWGGSVVTPDIYVNHQTSY